MHIEWVKIKGFRNFKDAWINFQKETLVIGSNDVGKTNLMYALRLLLDSGLSEREIKPSELDFHVDIAAGNSSDEFQIIIKFANIQEDAIRSILKGSVNDQDECFFKYEAQKNILDYKLFVGNREDEFEEINSRFYLKYLNLRYIKSQRDLENFIRSEKKHLLQIARDNRSDTEMNEDNEKMSEIQTKLNEINGTVRDLHYVQTSTDAINEELQKLAHHHRGYQIRLETGAIEVNQFIEKLNLGANIGTSPVTLGGDGRNNQILMALWKAKSEREIDIENEVVIYCIEEPEAHLHPHQQRKLASYLTSELAGQAIITSHSPQIASSYKPDSIIRLLEKNHETFAASNGCSVRIEEAWFKFGYRMSIIPAEAFFSDAVLLVEGPSEVLFYYRLAKALNIDLDFYNISILSVDGIAFKVYTTILNALEIPWALRTDNDIFKVPKSNPQSWHYAGLNRALQICSEVPRPPFQIFPDSVTRLSKWEEVSLLINPKGVFVSRIDLENDLAEALPYSIKKYASTDNVEEAVEYLQKKKAIRMSEYLARHGSKLKTLEANELAKPLLFCKAQVEANR